MSVIIRETNQISRPFVSEFEEFIHQLEKILKTCKEWIDHIVYEDNDKGEYITVVAKNKYKYTINITGDSYIAIIEDVVRVIVCK